MRSTLKISGVAVAMYAALWWCLATNSSICHTSPISHAHLVLQTELMMACQGAATTRRIHFVVFDTVPRGSTHVPRARVFQDINSNAAFDMGDPQQGSAVHLLGSLEWLRRPDWIAIHPNGEVRFHGGAGVSRAEFEEAMSTCVSGFPPASRADFVLLCSDSGYQVYFDLEESCARLRRPHQFTGE